MTENDTAAPSAPDSKSAWRKRNDAGPHVATFPSGAVLKFRLPDAGTLLKTAGLPQELRETALLAAGHPEGAAGYMQELVAEAIIRPEHASLVSQAIENGLDLEPHLVAEMLVEPKVTAEEVAAGNFPSEDVRMLLEFGERRRNVDAEGVRLPIIVARDWARFRDEQPGPGGAGNGNDAQPDARADVPEPDDGHV